MKKQDKELLIELIDSEISELDDSFNKNKQVYIDHLDRVKAQVELLSEVK